MAYFSKIFFKIFRRIECESHILPSFRLFPNKYVNIVMEILKYIEFIVDLYHDIISVYLLQVMFIFTKTQPTHFVIFLYIIPDRKCIVAIH